MVVVYHSTASIIAMSIWSLVRKSGAFAHYRYRDDLFPSLVFRRAYDALQASAIERADRHYVRLLHLAASTSESDVETAIGLLLEQHVVPTFDTVRTCNVHQRRCTCPSSAHRSWI